jgi:ATP-dependent RNA helicase DDX3X
LLVVATPGRLTDFVDRSIVSLSYVRFLILDEADRMLDMGFEPQIRKLVQQSGMTPKAKRQTLLFSATFAPEIQKLAGEFLRPYVWIAVGRVGSTTSYITQVLVQATPDKRHKLQLVVEALKSGPEGRTLIFVQKKRTATWLKKQLQKGGPDDGQPNERFTPIPAEDIHGDRSQSQREAALASFRAGKCRVLVATDVAARGLDISGVEQVINMDLPNSKDDFDSYVHRIGRTGRAGHMGLATSLFVPGDDPKAGNGRIAGLMVTQLREAEQEVPEWLEQQVAGGGGGGAHATKRKQPFSSSDMRRDEDRSNNGGKRQHQSEGGGRNNGGGRGRGRGGRRGGRGRGRGEQA